MSHFPDNFVWGTSTSSYQIEGAHNKDGKGPSIWDGFTKIPGKIANGHTGDMATNHYHLFQEDVNLLKQIGVNAYRFSISWPRLVPNGKDIINPKGLDFYSKLIDSLLEANIQPWATLYHWDLPLALQMEHDGWLSSEVSDRFAEYADLCFKTFGDRVKNWITINEPWVVSILGYGQGVMAPGRVSNSEPYLAAHNLLLAHAKSVDIFRSKYGHREGSICMANNCDWREPLTDSPQDKEAAERALEFYLGWFTDPLYFGEYPKSMVERLGDRLPQFSTEESALLKGSCDHFALNHYTTMYAADSNGEIVQGNVYGNGGISEDQNVILSTDESWEKTTMGWAVVPWGCERLLKWITERYGNPEIYLTENGCSYDDKVEEGRVHDEERIHYFKSYLKACQDAIDHGVRLKGYFAWSFLDNFEWALGYEKRFGLVHVDYDNFRRTPKESAHWYKNVISQGEYLR